MMAEVEQSWMLDLAADGRRFLQGQQLRFVVSASADE